MKETPDQKAKIERVARALCDAADWSWPKGNAERGYWLRLARAAIAAGAAQP